VQPSSSAVAAFQAFAEANKIATTTVSPAGEWIEFTTTIEHANTIFAAKYQTYTHAATSAALTRTLAYSLPDALVGHVDTVLPTTSFDTSDMRIAPIPVEPHASNVPISCNTTITPKCLELIYQFPSTPARDKKNTMVVTGYLDQYAQQADLSVRFSVNTPRPYSSNGIVFSGARASGHEPEHDLQGGLAGQRHGPAITGTGWVCPFSPPV
jgi:tripeptidyl-peptidase-1